MNKHSAMPTVKAATENIVMDDLTSLRAATIREVGAVHTAPRHALLAGTCTAEIRAELAKLTVEAAVLEQRRSVLETEREHLVEVELAAATVRIAEEASRRLIELIGILTPPPSPEASA